MNVLTKAARAAHNATLAQVGGAKRYSQFPVHEAAFWEQVFVFAKDPKKARKVLDELQFIEDEPCIENDRVWNNVRTARSIARLALMN